MCCPLAAYGRRLDRFHVIICIIAIHYSLSSCLIRFPYLHTCIPFTSPRCLCIIHSARHFQYERKSVICYITDITLSRMTLGTSVVCYITDITLSQWLLGRQPSCAQDSALAPDRRGRKGRKGSNIVGPCIPYELLQTNGEKCAKFGWDQFRNLDLYKVQTNKNERKSISASYMRLE